MSPDFYRMAFWLVVVLVLAQAFFLHIDANNINDLKARVSTLEAQP